jgi:hypothetical protein
VDAWWSGTLLWLACSFCFCSLLFPNKPIPTGHLAVSSPTQDASAACHVGLTMSTVARGVQGCGMWLRFPLQQRAWFPGRASARSSLGLLRALVSWEGNQPP